jgi:Putative beta-barrel porin-2, OmpL-like. bbp2
MYIHKNRISLLIVLVISLGILNCHQQAYSLNGEPAIAPIAPLQDDADSQSKLQPIEFSSDNTKDDSSDSPTSTVDVRQAPQQSTAATPARRALPAPIDSPPFPSGEWQIGGTSVIGAPDTSDQYPLMAALSHTSLGQFLEENRIKLYGWTSVGGNVSSSSRSNFPESYSIYPNRVDLDQLVFNIERIPDTVQKDHLDWGFRFSPFYGIDYHFTTGKGYFSNQLTKNNSEYGFDPVLVYGDLYIPYIAQGMNIRVGRFLSIPDIEAQLAPDNYTFTHSLMYTVDAYTQTGVVTSTKLNNNWTVQAGITDGNDVALWAPHFDVKPTGLLGVQWISKSNKDSIYSVVNAINDGKYSYNNIQEYVTTWSHKFNERVHIKTEAWYMWEGDVPTSTLPASVYLPGQQTIFTNEWACVNYLEIKLSPKSYLTIRNEYMNDQQGQRTGFADQYTSHTIGVAYWFTKWLGIRPELRYERAYDTPAYSLGYHKNQFMLAADLITRF